MSVLMVDLAACAEHVNALRMLADDAEELASRIQALAPAIIEHGLGKPLDAHNGVRDLAVTAGDLRDTLVWLMGYLIEADDVRIDVGERATWNGSVRALHSAGLPLPIERHTLVDDLDADRDRILTVLNLTSGGLGGLPRPADLLVEHSLVRRLLGVGRRTGRGGGPVVAGLDMLGAVRDRHRRDRHQDLALGEKVARSAAAASPAVIGSAVGVTVGMLAGAPFGGVGAIPGGVLGGVLGAGVGIVATDMLARPVQGHYDRVNLGLGDHG